MIFTESDWALSTIPDVDYIKPLEEYCEKVKPCDVPIAFPKLLSLIGKSSEDELDRICGSSIPSFFLSWMGSISNETVHNELGDCLVLLTSTLRSSQTFVARHKSELLAFIDHSKNKQSSIPHLTILAQLCFFPHFKVSKMALKELREAIKSDDEILCFIRTLKIPSGSTARSSRLDWFAGRLCSSLAEHVSEMNSLFAESSPPDATTSALSITSHVESPHLVRKAVVNLLCHEFSLLDTLLVGNANDTYVIGKNAFDTILLDSDCVPRLDATIITCLDLLEQQNTESNSLPQDQTGLLITVLNWSWHCVSNCLCGYKSLLHGSVDYVFSDVSRLCSLLERTCRQLSPTRNSHLEMIVRIYFRLPRLFRYMLEFRLIERVIDASNSFKVPTTNSDFHTHLLSAIVSLLSSPIPVTEDQEERRRIQKEQFECVFTPAKRYLQFIALREEFVPRGTTFIGLSVLMNDLYEWTSQLEHTQSKPGKPAETGREKWEVGWLVENTDETFFHERLKLIRKTDEEMKQHQKERWRKRVERQREAGHEDAMEGWMTRRDNETPSEIVDFMRHVSEETGMNLRLGE
ncbi:hypothetical protein BLNAU_21392 [Blattamonas nauphoetae]|uniref:Uncharacterized protein n=1 Tax=Blattamonas nauphoetae TaxID=2049346 RepID=A0ABQ9WX34_9EUKA|nr:hypothetical protein BLNAU_21392 [Blattamonas nauphoetae]